MHNRITCIYTSAHRNIPKYVTDIIPLPINKSFIIVEFVCNRETVKSFEKDKNLNDIGTYFSNCALKIKPENMRSFILVTSNRKIVKTLDYICQKNIFIQQDKSVVTFREKCRADLKNRAAKKIPTRTIDSSRLFPVQMKNKLPASANTVSVVRKKSKSNNQLKRELFVHKQMHSGRAIIDLEVVYSYLYRWLLGERHPVARAVYRGQLRDGIITKKYHQLIHFSDFYANRMLDPDEMAEMEVGKVVAAALAEEEIDFHYQNWGAVKFNGKYYAVKYDDNQSGWSVTRRYNHMDPDLSIPGYSENAYQFSLPMDEQSIRKLPFVTGNPRHFPGSTEIDMRRNYVKAWIKLSLNKKFNDDKYYILLKKILTPPAMYTALANAKLTSEKNRDNFIFEETERQNTLLKCLLNMPEFYQYIDSHPEAIVQIINEWQIYNESEKEKTLRFDNNVVIRRYNNLRIEMSRREKIREKARHNKYDTILEIIKWTAIGTLILTAIVIDLTLTCGSITLLSTAAIVGLQYISCAFWMSAALCITLDFAAKTMDMIFRLFDAKKSPVNNDTIIPMYIHTQPLPSTAQNPHTFYMSKSDPLPIHDKSAKKNNRFSI